MQVQDGFPLVVGEKGPYGQDLLDPCQGVDKRHDGIRPSGIRPHHQAAASLGATYVNDHGGLKALLPGEGL